MSDDKSTVQDREQIAGKIVRFDNKAIVLVDASRKVRVQRGLPILNRIPYINRMFKNTAIVDERLQGELAIDRSEIRSIKIVK
jgi:hypothetical protein